MKRLRWIIGFLFLVLIVLMMAPGWQNAIYAAPSENAPIWRAQITLKTADVKNAGTDDDIKVQLNASNTTWVDYARDDFERNSTFTYDLVLDNVQKIQNITMLKIQKSGSDKWCLKSITLFINGKKIYDKDFGSGQWFGDGHPQEQTIASAALRSHPSWQSFTQPFPPMLITRAEMESRIESIVGNYIRGTELYWGHLHGRGVEAWRKDSQTLHFDLDLAKESWWFDPEVDIDFDLKITCSGGKIGLEVKNVKADVDWDLLADILTLSIIDLVSNKIASKLTGSLKNLSFTTNTGVPICPKINVLANGDIQFSL